MLHLHAKELIILRKKKDKVTGVQEKFITD